MKQLIGMMLAISLVFFGSTTLTSAASPFLKVAKETGIEIVEEDGVTIWKGPHGGKMKPKGPLAGKKSA